MAADFDGHDRAGRWASAPPTSRLRLWTPRGATVGFVKQVAPRSRTSPPRAGVDDRTGDYPTGAWGDETRDYHVRIAVPPQPGRRRDARRARQPRRRRRGRVAVVGAGDLDRRRSRCRPESIRRSPTTRGRPSWRRPSPKGSRRAAVGDEATATGGSAGRRSWPPKIGHDEHAAAAGGVVDIDDASTGTVRLGAGGRGRRAMAARRGLDEDGCGLKADGYLSRRTPFADPRLLRRVRRHWRTKRAFRHGDPLVTP